MKVEYIPVFTQYLVEYIPVYTMKVEYIPVFMSVDNFSAILISELLSQI